MLPAPPWMINRGVMPLDGFLASMLDTNSGFWKGKSCCCCFHPNKLQRSPYRYHDRSRDHAKSHPALSVHLFLASLACQAYLVTVSAVLSSYLYIFSDFSLRLPALATVCKMPQTRGKCLSTAILSQSSQAKAEIRTDPSNPSYAYCRLSSNSGDFTCHSPSLFALVPARAIETTESSHRPTLKPIDWDAADNDAASAMRDGQSGLHKFEKFSSAGLHKP